ncbi:MAG: T9SS type A sorting domain-containing protein [Saprospiraceae bacterium]|nr:T9SS type A sorting domain-containing protein [Saprospiraceae bacterium]
MRGLLVLILLAFSFVGYGQIINFPDPTFKWALVNTKCVDTDGDGTSDSDADINDDGEIDMSEAADVASFIFEVNNIASLDGMNNFINLQNLKLHNLPFLKKLEFRHLKNLVHLTCNFTPSLKSIKLDSLPVFKNLHIYDSSLDTLLLGKLESLDSLFIHETNLKTISLDSLVLTKLIFSNNFFLKNIHLNNLERLESLELRQNRLLEELNYSGKENLKKLDFFDNLEITNLGLSSFKLIEQLFIQGAIRIKTLDVNHLVNLENIVIASCGSLLSMNISDLDKLQHIQIVGNRALYDVSIANMSVLESLNIRENNIAILNVENTPQLVKLDCSQNIMMELRISYSKLLKGLMSNNNALEEITLENLPNLQTLDCSGNLISSLDLHHVPKLELLNFSFNSIENVDLSTVLNLLELVCANNNLRSLDVSNLSKLEYLDFFVNSIDSINLGQISSVKYFRGSANKLTSLNVNLLDGLESLFLNDNLIKNINISNKNNLAELFVSNNGMTELELNNLPHLDILDCSYNDLFSLNLNSINGSYKIMANNCNLYEILLKNGFADGKEVFDVNTNPNLRYICVDDDIEKSRIKSILDIDQIKDVEINSYCSFQPGNAKYYVYSTVYYDIDGNGCNSTDQIVPYFKFDVKSDSLNRFYMANDSGMVTVVLQEGEHLITPQLENPNQFIITPQNILIPSLDFGDTITQNFCITPKGIFRQTNITVIPLIPPARPGFDASYKIVWENVGNQIESGTLNFTYDETLLDYISATQTADQVADGIVKWNFSNLLPFEKREITVTLKVNRPTDTPAVNAGDKLYITASILDNIFTLENTVVGSYDPNDKTCLQGDRVHPDMIGKYVDYLIRFENTGTYAAENVVVKDIIDTKRYDVSTLQITDASHEVYTRIEGNKVEFIFENIQLPFDDANNDGYIAFKIKTLPTLQLGDSLKNLADIYFDYNFPIRTNEAQTTVALPSFTQEWVSDINVYPNPVSDILHLQTEETWTKAEIFDVSGRIMRAASLSSLSIDVSTLESGTYFVRLRNGDRVGRVKFVKM